MFKVGCYITGSKGLIVLKTLLDFETIEVVFVVFEKNLGVKGNSFEEIKNLCTLYKLPIINRREKTPIVDLKFAAGWKWIIEDQEKLIILHDSILPRLKGFSPLVTSLINGDQFIGSTALWASKDYDCGNIIYQTENEITETTRVSEAIKLVENDYHLLVIKILNDFIKNNLSQGITQDESKSSYSMWRDQEDYHIDWNLSAEEIKRFIYAVGHPFEGAFSIIKGEKIRIVDCELIQDLKIENRTVGKVFSLTKNQPVIVAKNGLIKITNATDDSGNPYKFDILKTRLQ